MGRVVSEYISSDEFNISTDWSQQYTSVYSSRLKQLKPTIHPPSSWSREARKVPRVLDLQPGEPSWVVGVIIRECGQKPNILEDVKRINHGEAPQHSIKYCTPEDKVFLEDEHGRMLLTGSAVLEHQFVTGLVVGVLGGQNQLGDFELLSVCYPELPRQPELSQNPSATKGKKIAFISGINISDEQDLFQPNMSLLTDILTESTDISRLIIAGNVLSASSEALKGTRFMRNPRSNESLDAFDRILATLGTLIPCSVMPGPGDPASVAFPQSPIHPALFKYTKSLLVSKSVVFETNPLRVQLDGVSLLGNSGQPVEDVARYYPEEVDSQLELGVLRNTLKWRHLAPTAPDTLWSPPITGRDHLVMDELPHVMFAGNCTGFATSVENNVRLICVPEFRKTGQIVLLDLSTLEPELIELA